MTYIPQLRADLEIAVRSKNIQRTTVIRGLLNAIHNEQIRLGAGVELSEEVEMIVLLREKKEYTEALEAAVFALRPDLIEKGERELQIVEQYLPSQLSDAEIRDMILVALETVQGTEPRNLGTMMKNLTPLVRGRYDMKKVVQLVKKTLTTVEASSLPKHC